MFKKMILFVTTILLYLYTCNLIYHKYLPQQKTIVQEKNSKQAEKISQPITQEQKNVEEPIGYLKIDKLGLYEELYEINSSKNNIEEHVTILNYSEEPDKSNSIIFIAAHSGTGPLAYFKELDKIKMNDKLKLIYKNKIYIYQVNNIWEIKKEGEISVEKENVNQLVLTTCSPTKNNYQLIINSILIKKESL